MIRSHFSPSARSHERNARLALLLFCSIEVFEGRKSQNDLVGVLTDYFRDFSVKLACFLDIKPWLSYLDEAGQKQLLVNAAEFSQNLKPKQGDPEVSTARSLRSKNCHTDSIVNSLVWFSGSLLRSTF